MPQGKFSRFHDVNRWAVEPQDERPARPDGRCFYCDEPIGGKHKKTCVIPSRIVRVKFSVEVEVTAPLAEGFDDDWVNHHYNESSWCGSNLISLLEQVEQESDGCLCSVVSAKVVDNGRGSDVQ